MILSSSGRPAAHALIDARGWLTLSWGGVAIFAAALAALLVLGRWLELRMAACFFAPLVAMMLLPHGLPSLLVAISTACTLLSAAGWALDWYAAFWWFDVVLHALNPFTIVAASMFMLWKADLVTSRGGRFVAKATLYGLVLGVAWELFELTFLTLTWADTLLDLAMDTLGSALGGWFAAWLIATRGLPVVGRRHIRSLGTRSHEPIPLRVRR